MGACVSRSRIAAASEAWGPWVPMQTNNSGTGVHGEQAASSRNRLESLGSETAASVSPAQIAYLRRLGLNHPEVMKVLRVLVGSIDPRAPMRVIKYNTFKDHGRIPRSDEEKTVLLHEVPDEEGAMVCGFPFHV